MSEIFEHGSERSTRSSSQKLKQPLYKTNLGQKSISYLGPSIWNKLPKLLKETDSINSFKHKFKDFYLNRMVSSENDIFMY